MSSNALSSQGMTLAQGNGASPEVFTAIAELSNIDGPSGTANEIDVTDLNSTAKEKKQGLSDEGQVTADLNFIPQNATHALLVTDKAAGAERNYRLSFTDSPVTTWTFLGSVNGLSINNGVDDVTKGSLTVTISGSITSSI